MTNELSYTVDGSNVMDQRLVEMTAQRDHWLQIAREKDAEIERLNAENERLSDYIKGLPDEPTEQLNPGQCPNCNYMAAKWDEAQKRVHNQRQEIERLLKQNRLLMQYARRGRTNLSDEEIGALLKTLPLPPLPTIEEMRADNYDPTLGPPPRPKVPSAEHWPSPQKSDCEHDWKPAFQAPEIERCKKCGARRSVNSTHNPWDLCAICQQRRDNHLVDVRVPHDFR